MYINSNISVNVLYFSFSQGVLNSDENVDDVQVWWYKWFLNGEEVEVRDETARLKYYTEDEAKYHAYMNKPFLKLNKDNVLEMKLFSDFIK